MQYGRDLATGNLGGKFGAQGLPERLLVSRDPKHPSQEKFESLGEWVVVNTLPKHTTGLNNTKNN